MHETRTVLAHRLFTRFFETIACILCATVHLSKLNFC